MRYKKEICEERRIIRTGNKYTQEIKVELIEIQSDSEIQINGEVNRQSDEIVDTQIEGQKAVDNVIVSQIECKSSCKIDRMIGR